MCTEVTEMTYKTLYFVDDERSPIEENCVWLQNLSVQVDCISQILWIKNYHDFVFSIEEYGVPDIVCFDYDLKKDKTGLDCAKFLCAYCAEHETKLPEWSCQTGNFKGNEEINKLMKSYLLYENAG